MTLRGVSVLIVQSVWWIQRKLSCGAKTPDFTLPVRHTLSNPPMVLHFIFRSYPPSLTVELTTCELVMRVLLLKTSCRRTNKSRGPLRTTRLLAVFKTELCLEK